MINPLLLQIQGAERLSLPNDLNMAQPLQDFASGGAVVPFQRPFLRGSDREYLEARQAAYDKYVADVNAYNAALTNYQTEVYNPYLSQVNAYNKAAAAYNTDVYQPYVSSYSDYEKALEAYNAAPPKPLGLISPGEAPPAEPTLKPFEMTAPTLASDFTMSRPDMPYKEEDVTKFQQEAAERAQFDAAQRGLAIEAINNPYRFNLSGFSISPRMFAQGGPVKNSAKDMLSKITPQKFALGGDLAQATAAQNAANLADEADEGISLPNPAAASSDATPTGAQAMLASLPKTQVSTKSSPTSASVKRTSKAMLTDKMGQAKGMAMEMEQLSAAKAPAPENKEPESARAQMEALALAYKLREREALDTAKGLMRATFSRPSLEKPSLLKGKLTKKRFADGGEAKKARGGETNESAARRLPAPSITNATLWADTVSRDMFPRKKDDVKRDAARHMLAAAIMADKTSPKTAETLGKLYEFKEAPIRTVGHWMGLSKPRPDYPTDVHNNALGVSFSRLTADPEKLTQAVREAIRQGTADIQPGRAALVPDPGRAMTYNTGDTPAEPPQYRHGGAVKHRRA